MDFFRENGSVAEGYRNIRSRGIAGHQALTAPSGRVKKNLSAYFLSYFVQPAVLTIGNGHEDTGVGKVDAMKSRGGGWPSIYSSRKSSVTAHKIPLNIDPRFG